MLRTVTNSYERVTKNNETLQKVTNELRKSYEKLQKVTNELRKAICGRHVPKSLKNGLLIRLPRQHKTKNQLRGSDRFRTFQKPFHRKNAPLARRALFQ